MSGPIIRKYGFPNFEKIFGERPLEHGGDVEKPSQGETPPPKSDAAKAEEPSGSAKKASSAG